MTGIVKSDDFLNTITIVNQSGGTSDLPPGTYRVRVDRRWNDYEIGGRAAGTLLDDDQIEIARGVGTNPWTPEFYVERGEMQMAERVRQARAAFDPTKVYFSLDSFTEEVA